MYLQYVFDIKKNSNIGLFLNEHQTEVNDLHVKGYYQDKYTLLSGTINSVITVDHSIQLFDIAINIPVSFGLPQTEEEEESYVQVDRLTRLEALSHLQIGRFYLSTTFKLDITYHTSLVFNGILSYSKVPPPSFFTFSHIALL